MSHFEIYINRERAGAYSTQFSFENALRRVLKEHNAGAIDTNSAYHNRQWIAGAAVRS